MSITSDLESFRAESKPARLSREPQLVRAQSTSDVVQWFLDYYWIRHPISNDTIAAYRSDLIALERWLTIFHDKTLLTASDQNLRAFLDSHYRTGGRRPGDVPSLACIKRFYFYLVEVGLRADDPTEHVYVRMPRLAKHNLVVIAGNRN
ncbi:MAG TPA: site-specific integrase [Steroidobacteraceae bacterium]